MLANEMCPVSGGQETTENQAAISTSRKSVRLAVPTDVQKQLSEGTSVGFRKFFGRKTSVGLGRP